MSIFKPFICPCCCSQASTAHSWCPHLGNSISNLRIYWVLSPSSCELASSLISESPSSMPIETVAQISRFYGAPDWGLIPISRQEQSHLEEMVQLETH